MLRVNFLSPGMRSQLEKARLDYLTTDLIFASSLRLWSSFTLGIVAVGFKCLLQELKSTHTWEEPVGPHNMTCLFLFEM